MEFVFHDGGRAAAGYRGSTGDCVTRSIAIATGKPYQEVYDALNRLSQTERLGKRKRRRSNSRKGVFRATYQRYLESLGWRWTSTMSIGSGCQVHLRASELPAGPLLVKVSRHLTAVIDGTLYDTHNCSRGGTRCVYGFFSLKPVIVSPPVAQIALDPRCSTQNSSVLVAGLRGQTAACPPHLTTQDQPEITETLSCF
jgi:hypothetical protein